jgi:hypothetical protein
MELWTTQKLARVLDLTTQRVGQLVKESVLPPSKNGKHDPELSVLAYLRFFQRRKASANLAEAQQAKCEIETELKTLQLRRERGELIEIAEAEKQGFKVGRLIRDGFQGMPDRIAGTLASTARSANDDGLAMANIHAILAEEIHGILVTLTTKPTATLAVSKPVVVE